MLFRSVIKETEASAATSADHLLDTRLVYETRLVLSRNPTPRELSVLRTFYKQAVGMANHPTVVKASTSVPESKAPGRELEALTAVGSVLFNLDAALVR